MRSRPALSARRRLDPPPSPPTSLGDAQVKDGSPAETSVVSYTVRQGDTLSLIAKKYYGNGRKYVALLEANSSRLAIRTRSIPAWW